MRLPLVGRKRSKKQQTLDTVASVAKAWGEWQLAKGAVKTAKGVPWKVVGAVAAGLAAAGIAGKKLLGGGGDQSSQGDTAFSASAPASTGPVPDPNAPGAASGGTTPAPQRGPVNSSDAPGAGPKENPSAPAAGAGTTGAAPDAPVAPTGPAPDPEAPKTPDE
jgi:hypothetical protein